MTATYTHKFDTPVYKGNVSVNTGLFIDGKWAKPVGGGDSIDVIDPASGKVITSVAGGGAKDIDAAVQAAKKAYKTAWGLKVPGAERGKLLGKLADLMEKHQDALAALEALNVGKHFHIARNVDIAASIVMIRYYAGWADKIHGKTIEVRVQRSFF